MKKKRSKITPGLIKPTLNLPRGFVIPGESGKKYKIATGKDVGLPGKIGPRLGFGGSGEVYLARDEKLERAVSIKIFNPLVQLTLFPVGSNTTQNIVQEYRQELKSLSLMRHRNIVTLLDNGDFPASELPNNTEFKGGETVHFLVNEFVPGESFLEFISKKTLSKEDFLKIVIQICNALVYLHETKCYLHCDVKGGNIIVDPISLDTVLLDFALTRNLNFTEVSKTERISLFGDWDLFPSLSPSNILKKMMETRKRLVTREKFKQLAFPKLDIFHFGKLLETSIPFLTKSLTIGDINYLQAISRRCKDFEKSEWYYNSMNELRFDIQKLFPDYETPHRIKSLGSAIRGDHIIQLPYYMHSVNLSDEDEIIVDSAQFQRLRNVLQLDLCNLIFPGATHTRFLHSIHCYQLMNDFLIELASDEILRMFMSAKFVRLAQIVALLHDIFQYPFLHVFEEIGEQTQDFKQKNKNVEAESEGQKEVLTRIEKLLISGFNGGPNLEEIILNMGISPDDIWGIIKGWKKALLDPEKMLIASFINAGVDIDKLGYLYYDSYFTGVPDGIGIDYNKLIRSSFITKKIPHLLAWKFSGLSPVEQVIMARYQLFRKVYWNPMNRGIISRIKYCLANLLEENKITMEEYVKKTIGVNQIGALQFLNDKFEKYFEKSFVLRGLLSPNRIFWKDVLPLKSGRYRKRLRKIPSNDMITTADGKTLVKISNIIKSEIESKFKIRLALGDVIIDSPGRKVEEVKKTLVEDASGEPRPIEELSEPVRHLRQDWVRHVKSIRIFVNPDILNYVPFKKLREFISEIMGW